MRNFGRTLAFFPRGRFTPRHEAELLELMSNYPGRRIRAAGRLHSWSPAPTAEELLVDLRHLNAVDVERRGDEFWVRIGAGCQIKRALRILARHGATLPTIGLISEQSIAGAAATATHGSGRHSLSHYLDEIRVAVFDPQTREPVVKRLTAHDGDLLRAARCSLGTTGIVLSVSLRCPAQYRVEEHLAQHNSLAELLEAEREYPLQQFFLIPGSWAWYGQHRRETDAPPSLLRRLYRAWWFLMMDLGLHLAVLLFVRGLRYERAAWGFFRGLLPWLVIRHWRVVDDSARMLIMEHELFRHVEIELFVPAAHLPAAVETLKGSLRFWGESSAVPDEATARAWATAGLRGEFESLRGQYAHHYPICIRKVLPDDALMSMSSGSNEPWYAVSLISYADPSRRLGFLRGGMFLTRLFGRLYGARPHWGKICPLLPEEVAPLYPDLARFRAAAAELDPLGQFRNEWTDGMLFGAPPGNVGGG